MSNATRRTASGRIDPGDYLVRREVLVERSDDLALAEPVRRDWEERLERFRAGGSDEADLIESLSALLAVSTAAITIDPVPNSDRVSLHVDGDIVGQWVSFAALAADATASDVLQDVDGWEAIDAANRGTVLSTLRPFVPSCPLCGSDVSLQNPDGCCCCGSDDSYTFACESTDCGAITYRVDKDTADAFR